MNQKYYLIAGEASGDLHGSNLVKALKVLDKDATFRAWGGDLMEAQGAELVQHIRQLAFMGFAEVAANIRTILGLLSLAKKDILIHKPDALILIDYPGFNLRIAKFAAKHGIKVYWYISPQVWAWKANRVNKLKKYVDEMLVILPFEPAFYKKYDFDVHYVGHPLLDAIEGRSKTDAVSSNYSKNVIALLPGSRKQEVKRMLPLMLKTATHFPDREFTVAGMANLGQAYYQSFKFPKNVNLSMDETYALLEKASAAIVTSGTATLETALFKVPEIVGYKGNPFSYWIARRLVNVPFISLVNLIAEKQVVPELIQKDWNIEALTSQLGAIIEEGTQRSEMLIELEEIHKMLGGVGASARAAELIHGWAHT
jgi:lipid-A-disaccharide synthase